MGKNMSAKECGDCGNLIYYGGKCNCLKPINEPSDEEIRRWESEMDSKRQEAIDYIDAYYEHGMNIKDLFFHIWYASTEILPNLEVQVIIDSNNAIHISTGSAGYVDFKIDPIGMKLPIKCWIHTHPFGSAYFSGTDIRTVSIWEPLMETAYVLGGEGHYGFWNKEKPRQLQVFRNHEIERTQVWKRLGEEE